MLTDQMLEEFWNGLNRLYQSQLKTDKQIDKLIKQVDKTSIAVENLTRKVKIHDSEIKKLKSKKNGDSRK